MAKQGTPPVEGADVRAIAEALPYVWSNDCDFVPPLEAPGELGKAYRIAQRYGISLPQSQKQAAIQLVWLAHDLIWSKGLGRPSARIARMNEKPAASVADLIRDIDTLIAEVSTDLRRAEAGSHSDTLSHFYTDLQAIAAKARLIVS